MFSKHNSMKLEINHRMKSGKNKNTWILNNMLLKNQWLMKKSKGKSGKISRQMKVKIQLSKIYGIKQKQFEVYFKK